MLLLLPYLAVCIFVVRPLLRRFLSEEMMGVELMVEPLGGGAHEALDLVLEVVAGAVEGAQRGIEGAQRAQ